MHSKLKEIIKCLKLLLKHLKMSLKLPAWHGPLLKHDRRTSRGDNINLEPGVQKVQHGQPNLDWVVSSGELLAIVHDQVVLLGRDSTQSRESSREWEGSISAVYWVVDTCHIWYLLVLPSEMTSLRAIDGNTSKHLSQFFSM